MWLRRFWSILTSFMVRKKKHTLFEKIGILFLHFTQGRKFHSSLPLLKRIYSERIKAWAPNHASNQILTVLSVLLFSNFHYTISFTLLSPSLQSLIEPVKHTFFPYLWSLILHKAFTFQMVSSSLGLVCLPFQISQRSEQALPNTISFTLSGTNPLVHHDIKALSMALAR